MKKVLILLLFALPFLANSQVKIELNSGGIECKNLDGSLRWMLKPITWAKVKDSTTGLINIASSSNVEAFYISQITSFKVNGTTAPITMKSIIDSSNLYKGTMVVSSPTGSGGGTATSTSVLQQVAIDSLAKINTTLISIKNQDSNLLSRKVVSIDNLQPYDSLKSRSTIQVSNLFATQIGNDTTNAVLKRLENKQGVSDSTYIKLVNQTIKDSSIKSLFINYHNYFVQSRINDSTQKKELLDSLLNGNNDRRLLAQDATLGITNDKLDVSNTNTDAINTNLSTLNTTSNDINTKLTTVIDNQTNKTQNTQIVDASGNVFTSTSSGSKRLIDVAIVDGAGNQITSFGGGGGGTQLFRASASGTGYSINNLLEFNGTSWRNITNPTSITTLSTPPTSGTIYPIQGGNITGQVTKTDRSGTITAANTAQTLMAANSSRYGWTITNKSNAIIYINEITTATGGNADYPLMPNETKDYGANIPTTTTSISIISSQLGAVFSCFEWSNPSTTGSTLFVQGATPSGQNTVCK